MTRLVRAFILTLPAQFRFPASCSIFGATYWKHARSGMVYRYSDYSDIADQGGIKIAYICVGTPIHLWIDTHWSDLTSCILLPALSW